MDQRVLDEPGFPEDFDPAQGLIDYLRAHNAMQWLMGIIVLCAIFAAAIVNQPAGVKQPETSRRESYIEDDDEPLDDEDHAAIAEAREGGESIPLETYFERRFDRAS